jgi:hypothetical protein
MRSQFSTTKKKFTSTVTHKLSSSPQACSSLGTTKKLQNASVRWTPARGGMAAAARLAAPTGPEEAAGGPQTATLAATEHSPEPFSKSTAKTAISERGKLQYVLAGGQEEGIHYTRRTSRTSIHCTWKIGGQVSIIPG